MMKWLTNLFIVKKNPSKEVARKRLQLLLIHDQIDLTPDELNQMKAELVQVIERYVQVNGEDTHVMLNRMDNQIKLVSSIPIQPNKKRASR